MTLDRKTYGTILSAMFDGICWQEDLAEAYAHMPKEYREIKKRVARYKKARDFLVKGMTAVKVK